jgi:hypothetical protein
VWIPGSSVQKRLESCFDVGKSGQDVSGPSWQKVDPPLLMTAGSQEPKCP